MILRLAFCSVIQLLKMFGLGKLKSWGKRIISCVFISCWKNTTAIETSDREAWGRKDAFVVEKELALLEMYLLGHVEVS